MFNFLPPKEKGRKIKILTQGNLVHCVGIIIIFSVCVDYLERTADKDKSMQGLKLIACGM